MLELSFIVFSTGLLELSKLYYYLHSLGKIYCGTLTLNFALNAGWSHFAQFTIAVVNKDPKKSKYSGNVYEF